MGTRRKKAVLRKVFLEDGDGALAGEYVLDDLCLVEYDDFARAMRGKRLQDGRSVYLGQHQATAVRGERLTLIAISLGPLGREEVAWAKAALVATEDHITDLSEAPAADPAEDLAAREARLRQREEALERREGRLKEARDRARDKLEGDIRTLWTQLAAMERQRDDERGRHETEIARLKARVDRGPGYLVEWEDRLRAWQEDLDRRARRTEAGAGFDLEAAQRDIRKRIKIIQEKALDLLAREERLREREEELVAMATRHPDEAAAVALSPHTG